MEETPHTCHTAKCTHAAPEVAHVRQRERQYAERKRLRQPSCRMNDDEYQILLQAAAACRMSVATFLARAAMKAARDLERTAAEIATEREIVAELFAVRRHLGYLGNNLNQVAKVLNSGADAPQAAAVLDAVQRAAARVETATGRLLPDHG
ncbi:plasmid mobilization protein [Actinacidiphila rubida]|uniref:plasmid mobilization protein n=1 Tax=Actinacidiphila rubida TaxID=310780 RepID=UPI001FE926EA|nr:plasmid mobilization relaxosome protein MobC [Actinacidiphila rubida]